MIPRLLHILLRTLCLRVPRFGPEFYVFQCVFNPYNEEIFFDELGKTVNELDS
jgi:hypothetical protein